jgi:allophanate hydrolase
MTPVSEDLQLQSLAEDYAAGRRRPAEVLRRLHQRASESRANNVWITLADWEYVQAQLQALETRRAAGAVLPLYGVPCAVKDNIDVAGLPTTAACPSFARQPQATAPVVRALCDAGAVVLGKTNLDQFATGLVGARSPYGRCASAFDARRISGGSSSGSALAVALGFASFALGTDTAGSGRVPAAFNNVVGLKPTRGVLSGSGVVPACRSLDCVSVFAGNVADALAVFEQCAGLDAADPFSRITPPGVRLIPASGFRFGVPEQAQLQFFGDAAAERAFAHAVQRLEQLGGQRVSLDFAPFQHAAELLYEGPWLAERALAFGEFVAQGGPGIDPTVAAILRGAGRHSAMDVFRAQYRLHELQRTVNRVWGEIDFVFLPTTPTSYTHEELDQSPIELNARLGTYTNFTNLLDLSGIAVPAGFKSEGQPFGVTLLGPAFAERSLSVLAARFHEQEPARVGATAVEVRRTEAAKPARRARVPAPVPRIEQSIRLTVVGAHLRGQPLHRELVELGARFEQCVRTAPHYRLYALAGTVPAKPGLVRQREGGSAIELEIYRLDAESFGAFTANVGAPLGIGNVELENGEWVKGFVCEAAATEGAVDISHWGGWRAYLASRA